MIQSTRWYWWTCTQCFWRTQQNEDPRVVEQHRDWHNHDAHHGDINPERLGLSHWPQ